MEKSKELHTQPDMQSHPQIVDQDTDFSNAIKTSWGEEARVRISGTDTNNSICIFDYRTPAGFGPPRHLHHLEDEIMLIREGLAVIWTAEKSYIAGPGDVVLLQKNVAHTWKSYNDEPFRATIIVTPNGFEQFFSIIERRGLLATDLEALTAVAEEVGLDIVGPPLSKDEVATILAGGHV